MVVRTVTEDYSVYSRPNWVTTDNHRRGEPIALATTIQSKIAVWIALAITVGLVLFNLVTFGGLGYYLYAIGDRLADSLFFGSLGRVDGDYYWPIAIWMGIWWPIGAFLIWFVLFQYLFKQLRSFWKYCLFVCTLLVFDVLLAGAFHVGAASLSPDYRIEGNRIIPAE
jgi:hypothetical protein